MYAIGKFAWVQLMKRLWMALHFNSAFQRRRRNLGCLQIVRTISFSAKLTKIVDDPISEHYAKVGLTKATK